MRKSRKSRRTGRRSRVARRKLGGSGVLAPRTPAKIAKAMGITGVVGAASRIAKKALGKRRSAGGTRTNLKRRKQQGTGSYSQWTQDYKSARFGKLTGKKVDSMSTDRLVMTHRLLGPFNDYGQAWLRNYEDQNGNQAYPLYLFELNSCNNIINGIATGVNPVNSMYQNGTGIYWSPQNGQLPAGGAATQSQWQLENSSHQANTAGSVPLQHAIHKWSSLDLELWGTRNKPTKFTIQLVQFSEDVLPDYGVRTQQASEFWQSLVKHYTYSPLAKMDDGFNRKKMKILRQYTYNIDPTANFENDPDPHVKTVKLYYRFNRKSNFAWKFSTAAPQSIADMTTDSDWQQEANQNQTQLHPNARLYVMVRASNFTKVTYPNVPDNSTTPSMSWRLRTCWMVNN